MKDNNENLNNELNDNEMEAVAGGFKWPWQKDKWTDEQKAFLKSYAKKYCGPEFKVDELTSKYSPKEFLKVMEDNGGYEMVKEGLKL